MRHHDRDRGAPEAPTLVKAAVAIAVLGVLGYDGFVTVATHLKAESDAQNAAYAASKAWEDSAGAQRNPQTAFQAALTYLATTDPSGCTAELTAESQGAVPGVVPDGCDYICAGTTNQTTMCGTHGLFSIDPDGTVHMVVRRQAKTLVFSHLGFMHNLLISYEQGDANQSQD
ncbi:MAG TPA: hypothetical protein VHV76_07600 [Mycobacteriales bacterium]|nr:hypothetical protein [Mycobacteriales bacterium]